METCVPEPRMLAMLYPMNVRTRLHGAHVADDRLGSDLVCRDLRRAVICGWKVRIRIVEVCQDKAVIRAGADDLRLRVIACALFDFVDTTSKVCLRNPA